MTSSDNDNKVFEVQQNQHKQENKKKLETQQRIYDLQEQQRLKRETESYYEYLD